MTDDELDRIRGDLEFERWDLTDRGQLKGMRKLRLERAEALYDEIVRIRGLLAEHAEQCPLFLAATLFGDAYLS